LGNSERAKVFEKSKNGHFFCPISENPMTFGKQEFPKSDFAP
jgi:hypothetical protein